MTGPPAAVPPGWAPAPEASVEGVPPEPPQGARAAPPRAVEVIGRGVDLNLSQAAQIRRASIYAGLLFLAALGPLAALVVVHSIRVGGFDWLVDVASGFAPLDLGSLAPLVAFFAVICVFAISVDVQLIAIGLMGGAAAGRRMDLHDGVRVARSGFWRLVFASIAVGLILIVPRQILSGVLNRTASESRVLFSTALDIVLSAPFAYVGAAVVLARATPFQAVRASWRIARRRWRLAFLVGIVNTAVSYLSGFAVGAGLDVLVRIAIALGIDRGLGTVQSIELVAIVAFAIVAVGSLTMTIAALSVAPQVVAWIGLGGPAFGVDGPESDTIYGPAERPRLVSLLMVVFLLVEVAGAAVTILSPP